jgi:hypothetical protein
LCLFDKKRLVDLVAQVGQLLDRQSAKDLM